MEDSVVKEKLLEVFYGNDKKLSDQTRIVQCHIDELCMNVKHIAFAASTTKERVLYNVIKLVKEKRINQEDLTCINKKNIELFTKDEEPKDFK